MAGIFGSLFGGKFPDTVKFEAEQNQLQDDYKRFKEIESSALLQRYRELDQEIHSGEFEKRVNDLKNKKFKDTEEFKHLERYKQLSKSTDIKTYLKFKSSGKARKVEETLESERYERFRELEKFVNSPEFFKEKSDQTSKSLMPTTITKNIRDLKMIAL